MRQSTSVLLAMMLVLSIAGVSLAQTLSSAFWTCMPPDSHRVSATSGNLTGSIQTSSPGFHVRDYVNGPGPDQRWWPITNPKVTSTAVSWGNETAQVETRWVQFAVAPQVNYTFTATEMTIYLGAKGTNAIWANLWYSLNADFSDSVAIHEAPLPMIKDSDSLYTFAFDAYVPDGSTLYIRVYPWYTGSPSTSKYLYMRNCTVSGTTKGLTYPASATWALSDSTKGGTGQSAATAGLVSARYEKLVNCEVSQYTGYNASQRVRIIGNSWPANVTDQIDSLYIEFAVSPMPGARLTVTALAMDLGCMGTANVKANIYYSTDPSFENPVQLQYTTADTVNNYLPRDNTGTLLHVTAEPDVLVDQGQTFYLRIYPWVQLSSVSAGKYLTLQNVVIAGEVEGTPVPALALWPFETDDMPETAGAVIAWQQAYSPAMMFYSQFANLPNPAGVTLKCGAIQTVSKTWAAEPAISDSLWFQYAVAPKHGGTLFIDGISLYMGGWFTNTIRAQICYSKDHTFAAKTVLIRDTLLVGNAVMPLSAALNETISTGETFYLRVYPYNTETQGWAKLVAVDSVKITAATLGVTADPPTVLTNAVTSISATFASSGGNVPTDGGAAVTAKGVCWDTTTTPTVDDFKTVEGAGSGSFVSQVTGLNPGVRYYLRAYATNEAGTAYGEEKAFITLDSVSVPAVVTAETNTILVKSAKSGGTVTAWGGDTLRVYGVCWNTTGDPTIMDAKTEQAVDKETFTSLLFPLQQNTTYYVRAYASNDKGTGYGQVDTFTTQTPAPDVLKVVARDGSGDYTTVQAAFNDVPDFYTGTWYIYVKAGVYYEKLLLDRNKTNVVLKGENAETTILTYDDYAGKTGVGGTSNCYSTAIDADDFIAYDITFQNTIKNDGTFADQQAVALRTNGDRQSYYNCRLLGYQDTYYTWGGRGTGRTYMKNCYIEGSVDFIFGRNIVVFDQCEIRVNRHDGALTAASTDLASKFGYVFMDCHIAADSVGFNGVPITRFILGRPWQAAPRTVFLRCEEPASVHTAGWATWNVAPALYAEYQCYGPGSDYSQRLSIGCQLTDEEAAQHTISNIFAKTSHPDFGWDWLPQHAIFTGMNEELAKQKLPTEYALSQNFPNPFNPVTTINYALPKACKVQIKVYNILGAQVMTLVDWQQSAGRYSVQLDGRMLGSGAYFYRIIAGNFSAAKKMLLLK